MGSMGPVASRVVLLLTFGVAGIAKLRDRAGTERTLVEFGLAKNLAAPGSVALPCVELLTAACLLFVRTSVVGAVSALVLLVLFLGGICYNLAHDRKPACNCFGQISSTPIGPLTVVRNVVLALFALAVVLGGPGPSFVSAARSIAAAATPLGVAVTAILAMLLGLIVLTREIVLQQGRMLERLSDIESMVSVSPEAAAAGPGIGLPVGSVAPEFGMEVLSGGLVTLAELRAERGGLLLLFMHPGCGPCNALVDEAGEWVRDRPGGLNVVIVSEGSAGEHRAKSGGIPASSILLQQEREVADAYQAWGTPSAVIVSGDGLIASGVAQGADAIRALLAEAAVS